jgi:apolipoprotein N-acyltransferase
MSVSADPLKAGGRLFAERDVRRQASVWAPRVAALAAGVPPVLAFPRPGLDLLAWVALVPALLLIRYARNGREAAIRGWWFGAGFLGCALYWLIPDLGPGLPLLAVVAGGLWAPWGHLVWACSRTGRLLMTVVAVASGWVTIEWVRSWRALGGPWALYGATQWRHPAVLGLASLGGIWLVGFALVAVNTAVVMAVTARSRSKVAAALLLAALVALSGPAVHRSWTAPAGRPLTVTLVQPGVVDGTGPRFALGERITSGLPRADLFVWGESSVGFDLARRPDLVARLASLARTHGTLLVNEDARDASGRIFKSAVLIGPGGIRGRYVKTRLVPFGEYIPLRHALGWLTRVSAAAREDRVPGTGIVTMRAGDTVFGPLICFESAFPDLGRAVVSHGAGLLVYESATSSFQDSWAPPQHAALGAVRAAETGRPVVQAALTGVSAAFDGQGRRLAWFDTNRRGAVTVRVTPGRGRTPYDRFGDYIAWLSVAVSVVSGYGVVHAARARRSGG